MDAKDPAPEWRRRYNESIAAEEKSLEGRGGLGGWPEYHSPFRWRHDPFRRRLAVRNDGLGKSLAVRRGCVRTLARHLGWPCSAKGLDCQEAISRERLTGPNPRGHACGCTGTADSHVQRRRNRAEPQMGASNTGTSGIPADVTRWSRFGLLLEHLRTVLSPLPHRERSREWQRHQQGHGEPHHPVSRHEVSKHADEEQL